VFAVVSKKKVKQVVSDNKDLDRYTQMYTVKDPKKGSRLLDDSLAVVAESSELAHEVITETAVEQVFGEKAMSSGGAFFKKHFVSIHNTDEAPGTSTHKRLLRLTFNMPKDAGKMAELAKLMALVPHYIDVVGALKLPAAAREKAAKARAKAAQEEFKQTLKEREEALRKKKQEQKEKEKAEEEAQNQNLSKEALRKREVAQAKKDAKKNAPKLRMKRM